MKEYLARLNPAERRFVVAVALAFFVVFNIFWIWPHFSDWSALKTRLASARDKIDSYQRMIDQTPKLKAQIQKMESEGADVPAEDQAVRFLQTIQSQAAQSGVRFIGNSRQITKTNQFFLEQIQTVSIQAEEPELVNFLYNLGTGNSLIRVRDLSLHTDPQRQKLNANITFVASYQKTPTTRRAAAAPRARTGAAKPATPKKQ